jgi:PilZ domain-containing protein
MAGQLTGEVTVYQPMTILDMSERGAQIETGFALHLDSLHEFRLSLGDRSVVVKGRIVHCQIGELKEGEVLYRTGLEFVEPSEHVLGAIRTFIHAQREARAHPAIVDAEIAEDGV